MGLLGARKAMQRCLHHSEEIPTNQTIIKCEGIRTPFSDLWGLVQCTFHASFVREATEKYPMSKLDTFLLIREFTGGQTWFRGSDGRTRNLFHLLRKQVSGTWPWGHSAAVASAGGAERLHWPQLFPTPSFLSPPTPLYLLALNSGFLLGSTGKNGSHPNGRLHL